MDVNNQAMNLEMWKIIPLINVEPAEILRIEKILYMLKDPDLENQSAFSLELDFSGSGVDIAKRWT